MTGEVTTYKKKLYEIYELYHDVQTTASGVVLTVTGKKPHADVIAVAGDKLKWTRVYVNGVRKTVTAVALNVNDTDITVTGAITSGDIVDIYLAATVGTLSNNTTTGKIPLIEPQIAENYATASNKFEQLSHGTNKSDTITLSSRGGGTLAIARRGDADLKNFILARKNKKYLMIIVKDTADSANTTYDVLHEARLLGYGSGEQARNDKSGIVTISVPFRFVPGVPMST